MEDKPLSFFESLKWGWNWFWGGLLLFWRVSRFEFFPTEESLLVSFWYDFQHYKAVVHGATVYDFLDTRVTDIKRDLQRTDGSAKRKQMRGDLLDALHSPRLRELIVSFLQIPDPEQNYRPVLEAIKSAWRTAFREDRPPSVSEIPTLIGYSNDSKTVPAQTEEKITATKPSKPDRAAQLYAKTYIIAADISFELKGKSADFKRIVHDIAELQQLIQKQFNVTIKTDTLKRLKDYSYRDVLDSRNDSKIGQLKPCFRQIIENPQVFGEKIIQKAKKIADDHFI